MEIFEEQLRRGARLGASIKLDGIRCRMLDGIAYSRSGKHIPNQHIQQTLRVLPLNGVDGEIVCLREGATSVEDMNAFNMTSSGVMSADGQPNFRFCMFDMCTMAFAKFMFEERFRVVNKRMQTCLDDPWSKNAPVVVWPTVEFHSIRQLADIEADALDRGFEGLIIRKLNSPYKFGRSTKTEGYLGKLKRFEDSEAKILKIHPLEHNMNEQFKTELGFSKRSTHKAGQVLSDEMMGRMDVQDLRNPQWLFSIGCGEGLDHGLRRWIWTNRARLEAEQAVVKYKYQPHGTVHAPRSGIMKGFRDRRDMGGE